VGRRGRSKWIRKNSSKEKEGKDMLDLEVNQATLETSTYGGTLRYHQEKTMKFRCKMDLEGIL